MNGQLKECWGGVFSTCIEVQCDKLDIISRDNLIKIRRTVRMLSVRSILSENHVESNHLPK